MASTNTLWYFADPMCSWCWGFTAVIERIKASYAGRLNIALMLGGLRPGTSEPMTAQQRDEILHHWHDVQQMTGAAFAFEGAMPAGFVYDTEPACRAVVSIGDLKPEAIFTYFKAVQTAFYLEQRDVTRPEILAELAQQQGVTTAQFLALFDSEAMKQKTQLHFEGTRQAGVSGFPTLVLQKQSEYKFIAKGYRPLNELTQLIDAWLEKG